MAIPLRAQTASPAPAEVDAALRATDTIFEPWNSTRLPGCTVGVSLAGKPVLMRAYGMADLEHGVANRTDSIIEAGSLSKQFTAAAVLLLVQQGKLSLDDPARRYIPELPDYGTPVTVRHMLTHTSGLRDWGSLQGIVGWPRTTRAYTHAHVLDIVSRQRSLNFTPGTAYSYSNTGYNLAAILVSRLSGKSFADFTREQIFEPLGMTRTSWRDDFTRVVADRSIAYDVSPRGVVMDMPFENVHGNGGLLTTVGDLLIWNENAVHAKVGGRALVDLQRETMTLANGGRIEYAFGLRVASWKGVPEVSHSGATAGYRAWLAQYPAQRLSVAVLCNAGNAGAPGLGHQVADLYLGPAAAAAVVAPASTKSVEALRDFVGMYRDRRLNDLARFDIHNNQLRVDGQNMLEPLAKDSFRSTSAQFDFDRDAKGRPRAFRLTFAGEKLDFDRMDPAKPSAADLAAYAGEYVSDEAELTLRVSVENGVLTIHRRPDTKIALEPTYADAFEGDLGGVRFLRNPKGAVMEMSISQERVWDLRFRRLQWATR